MIAGIRGRLEALGADHALIDVGGIYFKVHVPTTALASLGSPGGEVRLHTYLLVREDALSLFGFASEAEREVFQSLLGVRGIGPKVAMALLSALSPAELAHAIAAESRAMLTQVPGIGSRVASRLIVELKGKLPIVAETALPAAGDVDEVGAALVALGYTDSEAAAALATLLPLTDLSTEEKLRLALQHLARS